MFCIDSEVVAPNITVKFELVCLSRWTNMIENGTSVRSLPSATCHPSLRTDDQRVTCMCQRSHQTIVQNLTSPSMYKQNQI